MFVVEISRGLCLSVHTLASGNDFVDDFFGRNLMATLDGGPKGNDF
jgi:hypothetical protein